MGDVERCSANALDCRGLEVSTQTTNDTTSKSLTMDRVVRRVVPRHRLLHKLLSRSHNFCLLRRRVFSRHLSSTQSVLTTMVVVETMKKHAYDTPPVYVTRAWSLSMIGRVRAVYL